MVYKIKLNPVAGALPDIDKGRMPGRISNEEKEILRSLARKVMEIANLPEQEQKRALWKKHNRLQKTKIPVLVFPEDSWFEILREDTLQLADPYWKQWEWYLKHLIYRHENLKDDFVIEPDLYVQPVFMNSGWGLEPTYKRSGSQGSFIWDPPVKEEADIKKLRHPEIGYDYISTQKKFNAVGEIFGDILPVRLDGISHIHECSIEIAAMLRGMEQIMLDMYDRPEWLHELMDFVSEGMLKNYKYYEANGHLRLNNKNHYTDSGGLGYTDELPVKHVEERSVKLSDMWGFGLAQELSEVSPLHHEEFCLKYQLKTLEQCGLNAYGCCEPFTRKFDMVKKIPRLRRISISPWCDTEVAAKELQDKYILSWKPNPSLVAQEFDEENIRGYIRENLCPIKDRITEIILKDVITVQNRPERLSLWLKIVRNEIERI